jgi:hypothetical protein
MASTCSRLLYNRGMTRILACLAFSLAACLSGCDLIGTTAATATGASAELKQAQEGKKIEQQVQQQVQQDVDQSRQRTEQAEKDAQ